MCALLLCAAAVSSAAVFRCEWFCRCFCVGQPRVLDGVFGGCSGAADKSSVRWATVSLWKWRGWRDAHNQRPRPTFSARGAVPRHSRCNGQNLPHRLFTHTHRHMHTSTAARSSRPTIVLCVAAHHAVCVRAGTLASAIRSVSRFGRFQHHDNWFRFPQHYHHQEHCLRRRHSMLWPIQHEQTSFICIQRISRDQGRYTSKHSSLQHSVCRCPQLPS
jgi:hypothetical protein